MKDYLDDMIAFSVALLLVAFAVALYIYIIKWGIFLINKEILYRKENKNGN